MKTILTLASLLLLGVSLSAQDKAALEKISAVFDEIDANFEDWPHYTYSAENLEGGQAYEHHVWKSDGDNGFIKVESLNFDEHGESMVQFYFKGAELLFTLDRSETSLMVPKAPTEVVEKRYYFAEGQLIRLLEKKGKLPEGKPTDTTALKNRVMPLSELENAGETYTTHHEIAAEVIERARLLDDESAPAGTPVAASAGVASGDGWRLIEGSRSRDGRFALAWGLKGQSSPQAEPDEDGALSVEPETEGLTNYVVNLRTGSLIGKTEGSHFGDKPTYNHFTNEAAWSSSSNYVAQVCSGKWATFDAHVYEVKGDSAVSKGVDLLEASKKAVFAHLDGGEQFKKFEKDSFAITLHDVGIVQRGASTVVVVEVSGQIPKSDEDGSYFDATVSFKIASDENGGAPTLQWSSTESHDE